MSLQGTAFLVGPPTFDPATLEYAVASTNGSFDARVYLCTPNSGPASAYTETWTVNGVVSTLPVTLPTTSASTIWLDVGFADGSSVRYIFTHRVPSLALPSIATSPTAMANCVPASVPGQPLRCALTTAHSSTSVSVGQPDPLLTVLIDGVAQQSISPALTPGQTTTVNVTVAIIPPVPPQQDCSGAPWPMPPTVSVTTFVDLYLVDLSIAALATYPARMPGGPPAASYTLFTAADHVSVATQLVNASACNVTLTTGASAPVVVAANVTVPLAGGNTTTMFAISSVYLPENVTGPVVNFSVTSVPMGLAGLATYPAMLGPFDPSTRSYQLLTAAPQLNVSLQTTAAPATYAILVTVSENGSPVAPAAPAAALTNFSLPLATANGSLFSVDVQLAFSGDQDTSTAVSYSLQGVVLQCVSLESLLLSTANATNVSYTSSGPATYNLTTASPWAVLSATPANQAAGCLLRYDSTLEPAISQANITLLPSDTTAVLFTSHCTGDDPNYTVR